MRCWRTLHLCHRWGLWFPGLMGLLSWSRRGAWGIWGGRHCSSHSREDLEEAWTWSLARSGRCGCNFWAGASLWAGHRWELPSLSLPPTRLTPVTYVAQSWKTVWPLAEPSGTPSRWITGRDFRCSVNLDRMQKRWNGVFRRENPGFVCKALWIMCIRDGLHLQGGWRELLGPHQARQHGERPRGDVGSFFSAVMAKRSFWVLGSHWARKHNWDHKAFCFSVALVRRNVAPGSVDSGILGWSKLGIRNAGKALEPKDFSHKESLLRRMNCEHSDMRTGDSLHYSNYSSNPPEDAFHKQNSHAPGKVSMIYAEKNLCKWKKCGEGFNKHWCAFLMRVGPSQHMRIYAQQNHVSSQTHAATAHSD